MRVYPRTFKHFLYRHFHNHLPEELFFEDFEKALKKSDKLTVKGYNALFKTLDAFESDEERLEAVKETIVDVTCMQLVDKEDPVVRRLALYILAHRNYLTTISFDLLRDYKVNWGLRKTLKLDE